MVTMRTSGGVIEQFSPPVATDPLSGRVRGGARSLATGLTRKGPSRNPALERPRHLGPAGRGAGREMREVGRLTFTVEALLARGAGLEWDQGGGHGRVSLLGAKRRLRYVTGTSEPIADFTQMPPSRVRNPLRTMWVRC
jgi:hypothetical protein